MPKPLSAVTDDEIRKALVYPENARTIRTLAKRFKGSLSWDEAYSCGLVALWRTLAKHDDSFGQKFSTSLYTQMRWECLRTTTRWKMNEWAGATKVGEENIPKKVAPQHSSEMAEYVYDCMRLLPEGDADVVYGYYVEGLTVEEISLKYNVGKETARQRLDHALSRLKELCLDPDLGCNRDNLLSL